MDVGNKRVKIKKMSDILASRFAFSTGKFCLNLLTIARIPLTNQVWLVDCLKNFPPTINKISFHFNLKIITLIIKASLIF